MVDVSIDTFTPATPKPGQPVTITGRVTNTSTATFDNPQAIACIDDQRLETRAELAEIPAENDKPVNEQRSSCSGLNNPGSTTFQTLATKLAPKASVPFKLVVPWNEWHISNSPGVYVVGVTIRGNPAKRTRVTAGRTRTLMPVISASPMPRKVNTATVLALRHRPTLLGNDRYADDSLAQAMAPGGALGRQLAAGQKNKVTWLVDPAMLEEASGMADGYKVLGKDNHVRAGTGQKVVRDWLAAFNATRARDQVILLPYGDPDVASLIDAGDQLRDLVRKARTATETSSLASNPAVRSGLWLDTGSATSRNLAAASTGYAGAKASDVNLVPSWSWPVANRPSLSPSPVYDVSTPEGPVKTVRTIIADSALTAGGPDPATAGSALEVRQRFAAETSLLAATGSGTITVVTAPPRNFDSDGKATAGLMEGLKLPWITPVGINDVLAGAGTTPRLAKPPTTARPPIGLSSGQLDQIKRLNNSTNVFTSLLANPDNADVNLRHALFRAASYSWRGFGDEAQRFINVGQRTVDGQLGKVHLVNSSVTRGSRREIKVNLSGSKGTFPLTVVNELDQTVRVGIVVTSVNRPDLRIEQIETKLLAAGVKATFQINASAQQNGLIRADAQVTSAAGQPIGRSQELIIQAAQYGSVGWILVGAAIALLFGTSLVRIYRRIRSERRNPSASTAVDEPDPLNPAPLEPAAPELAAPELAAPGDDEPGLAALEPNPLDPPTQNGTPQTAGEKNYAEQTPGDQAGTQDAPHDVPQSMREGVGTKDG
ncbi:MAG: hypothetical protein QOG10_1329 [Kribbellaceae bacterium]|nr:hypothetical protein [Kribbellaceae bacterium]